ncbi:MAG TPA: S41 family peptidase [Tepidisphaeraceae bacterium]|jgi:carboxyl-terminal processing protease|nr:S41 family peptidase [Tepidisphaeraceae bacterium]
MNRVSRAGILVVALALIGAMVLIRPAPTRGASEQQVASVEQLKNEAFKALRSGQFDRSNELLGQAAALSHDPSVQRMAGWTSHFENQRQEFATERHEQYKKSLGNVELLINKGHPDYAIDAASRAWLLSGDKAAFRSEPGVDQLIKDSIERAASYDRHEQWIKSLRIYSDLTIVEPALPIWKDDLKQATRRVRLLALYTPDVLKSMQDGDSKEREEVEAILKAAATTQPATQPSAAAEHPTTQPVADKDKEGDSFKVDWRETLRGIRLDMLWDALVDAKQNYYREVTFKQLALGGLNGVQAVVSTSGLEKAFPGLADPVKKAAFIQALDDAVAANGKADDDNSQRVTLRRTLTDLKTINDKTVKIPEEVLVSEFADGAFAVCDPFTNMIWPSDVEEFKKVTEGEFSGVGIQIESGEDGSLKVVSPLEDTPAYKAGIKAGDVVTKINNKSAKGISLNQAVRTITGPPGTMVKLTVRSPDGTTKDYDIKRETIKVASIKGYLHKPGGGWDYMVDPESKIAYIRLTNFTKDSPKELDKAIDQIKEAGGKGIIFDLRYNPGGLLSSATEIADKFLKEGVIVSTHPDRDTGNPPTVAVAKPQDSDCNLPLVVLVNQYSASASEIVSGALKDQKRGLIVGERTFGKGSVQMLFPLADRSAYLKLTTSHYYLPSGRCIHREENSKEWGVEPDVTVEMTPEQMRGAIDARQALDILRAANEPAKGETPKLEKPAEKGEEKLDKKPKKDLLSSDPQLSGAVLLLKLELAGAQI